MTRSRPVPTADIHLGTAEPQLDARTLDTDLVTVGIGCNDYCAFSNLIDTLSHGS